MLLLQFLIAAAQRMDDADARRHFGLRDNPPYKELSREQKAVRNAQNDIEQSKAFWGLE